MHPREGRGTIVGANGGVRPPATLALGDKVQEPGSVSIPIPDGKPLKDEALPPAQVGLTNTPSGSFRTGAGRRGRGG